MVEVKLLLFFESLLVFIKRVTLLKRIKFPSVRLWQVFVPDLGPLGEYFLSSRVWNFFEIITILIFMAQSLRFPGYFKNDLEIVRIFSDGIENFLVLFNDRPVVYIGFNLSHDSDDNISNRWKMFLDVF